MPMHVRPPKWMRTIVRYGGSQSQGTEIFLTRNNVKTPVNQTGQFFHGKVAWLR